LQPYPVAHRQLLLVELPPDLGRVGRRGFSDPPDPHLAAWLQQLTWDHATRHGWSPNRRKTVRQTIRILLALQATPGAPIPASEVARMTTIGLPVRPVLAILAQAGMLDDDRTPQSQRWFDRQVAGLPAAMAGELRDGRLHLGDRTILLAAPVRQRLAAWLDDRNMRWPNTANPHLFIHYRTATQTRPVGLHWLYLKLDSSSGRSARTASLTRCAPAPATCAACATCSASASRPPNATPPPSTTQP
jgi:hypothetical protein